jgi:hypothetical protein
VQLIGIKRNLKRNRENKNGEETKERRGVKRREKVVAWACEARTEEAMEGPPKASTRRRRLVERGSDRLAFITGQASALPPSDPYPGNHRGAKFFSFVRIRKPVAFTPDWIRL